VNANPQPIDAAKQRRRRQSRTATPFVALDRSLCEACWRCVAVCPKSVLGKVEVLWHKHAVIDAGEHCTGCGKCLRVCPSGALSGRGVASQAEPSADVSTSLKPRESHISP